MPLAAARKAIRMFGTNARRIISVTLPPTYYRAHVLVVLFSSTSVRNWLAPIVSIDRTVFLAETRWTIGKVLPIQHSYCDLGGATREVEEETNPKSGRRRIEPVTSRTSTAKPM